MPDPFATCPRRQSHRCERVRSVLYGGEHYLSCKLERPPIFDRRRRDPSAPLVHASKRRMCIRVQKCAALSLNVPIPERSSIASGCGSAEKARPDLTPRCRMAAGTWLALSPPETKRLWGEAIMATQENRAPVQGHNASSKACAPAGCGSTAGDGDLPPEILGKGQNPPLL